MYVMPLNIAFTKVATILDISGFTLFVGSYALKASERVFDWSIPDVIQNIASIGAVIYVLVKIIGGIRHNEGVKLDNESKRMDNEKKKLGLDKMRDEHEKSEE